MATKRKTASKPKAPPKPKDKVCQVVLDSSSPRYRVLLRCPGHPDVCLLDLGGPAVEAVIHAEGSSGASVR